MINERRAALTLLALALTALAACERPHRIVRSSQITVVAPPAAPPPRYVMICKSSRTGLPARCGTPGAVMVGMKPE
jgi:hypothetical protein